MKVVRCNLLQVHLKLFVMASKFLIKSPVEILEGYGLKGVKLTLNLQQCQKLSAIYHSLNAKVDLTSEEQELGGLLQVFKDFAVADVSVWANLVPDQQYDISA